MVFQCLSAWITSVRENWRKYFYAWRVSLFLIGVVVSNRFANYSITGVYMDYITSEWDTPIYAAAMIINLKEALTSLFSIFGATYATHSSGRYNAIRLSLLPFIIGLGLFPVGAMKRLQNNGVKISLVSVALLFTAMGEGMQKHTVFAFGYDQFEYQMHDKKKAKRQANIWWGGARFAGTMGGLIASSLLIQFRNKKSMSWWVFGGILSFGLTLLTSIIFILGKLSFHRAKIAGKSPIINVLKVVVAAIRKRHLPYATDARFIYAEERSTSNESAQENPCNSAQMPHAIKTIEGADQVVVQDQSNQYKKEELAGDHGHSRNHKLRYLEKASIIESPARIDIHVKQWRLCSSNKAKDAKMVFGFLPLWSTFLTFQVVKAMGDTFFLVQGGAMQSTISSANITLAILLFAQNVSEILITQLLSLYKKVAKRRRLSEIVPDQDISGIPPLFRIGIGLFISICCCIVAGMVERRRLSEGVSDQGTSQMSIFWLLPQCFLLGAASGFAEDGVSDFFDESVDPNLRVCYRLTSESVKGVGVLINSCILAAIYLFSTLGRGHDWIGKELNTSKLHFVYFIIAGMSTMNLLLYFFVCRKYCKNRQVDHEPFLPADKIPKEDQSPLPTRQDDEQEDVPDELDP